MPSRSRRLARRSTTSRRTSSADSSELGKLIAELPRCARPPGVHAPVLGGRPARLVRAARIPRATACSSSRSRGRSTTRTRTSPRGSWHSSARTSSRARAARSSQRARPAGAARSSTREDVSDDEVSAWPRTATSARRCSRRRWRRSSSSTASSRSRPRSWMLSAGGSSMRRRSYVDHKTELQEELAREGRQVTLQRGRGRRASARATFTVAAHGRG